MANQTASERAGLPAEDITIEDYQRTLVVRVRAFTEYMTHNHPEIATMDECDWDDQYESWLSLDSTL